MMNIDRNDTYLPKIGTGPDFGISNLPRYRTTGGIHHAVMQRRNHTFDSAWASLIALTLSEGRSMNIRT